MNFLVVAVVASTIFAVSFSVVFALVDLIAFVTAEFESFSPISLKDFHNGTVCCHQWAGAVPDISYI